LLSRGYLATSYPSCTPWIQGEPYDINSATRFEFFKKSVWSRIYAPINGSFPCLPGRVIVVDKLWMKGSASRGNFLPLYHFSVQGIERT
jgi:hypothetical protein